MVATNGARGSRVRGVRRSTVVVLVLGALVATLVTGCATTSSTTVQLVRTGPDTVSQILGIESDASVTTVQIRLTSNTGASVEVQASDQNGNRAADQHPVTVVDNGSWTSVSPVHPVVVPPGVVPPTRIRLRLTMASATPVTVPLEIRGINALGIATGWSRVIEVKGPDCGLVTPFTDASAVDLSGKDLVNCIIPGVTLAPGHLTGTRLEGADLTGATVLPGTSQRTDFGSTLLRGATLANVTFDQATFAGADLTGANLAHAGLVDSTTLEGATLAGVDLSTVALTGIHSGGIVGTPLVPAGWRLYNGYLVHRTAYLVGADLHSGDFHGFDFSGTDLGLANLKGADLRGATFAGANLTFSSLANANLDSTILGTARFTTTTGAGSVGSGGIIGTPASLPAPWKLAKGWLVGPNADLSGADLSGTNLAGATLASANLTGANLTGTNLTGADVNHASIDGATVTGAQLAGADLYGLHSAGIVGTPATVPPGWHVLAGALFGHGASVQAELVGMDLSNFDLSEMTCRCTMTGTNLTGANMSSSSFDGLAGANLTNADLTNAGISGSIAGATIAGAKLAGATFTHVYSGGLIGVPASLPAGASVLDGYLLGQGTFLVNVDLSGRDLRGRSFAGVTLQQVNLTATDLRNVSFEGAVIQGALFVNAQIDGANLKIGYNSGIDGVPGWEVIDFTGATGTPIYAGALFVAVRCPDGTLASAHGSTCQGHPWP